MSEHDDNIVTVCQTLCTKLKKQLQDVFRDTVCFPERNLESRQFFFERQKKNIFDTFALLEIQLRNWKQIRDEHNMVQLKLHELVLDANAKRHCIEKLKETLSSQYVQIEHLKHYNKKLEGNLECFKNELNRSHLSEEWFKNRLYSCQADKSKLNFELAINKKILEEHVKTIQTFNAESKDSRQCFQDKIFTITECKNKIHKYKELCVKNSIDKGTQTVDDRFIGDRSTDLNAQLKLNGCNDEVDFLKRNSHELQNHSNEQELNMVLGKRCSNVEKSIIETFKHFEKQLCEKLITSKKSEKNKNMEISRLMKEINILKMKMYQQIREKENLEGLTFKIYKQFFKLKSIHGYLKALLKDREQLISVLCSEKIKLIGNNDMYRNIEYYDKKKIRELLETVHNHELEKQEMARVHYEELFDYNKKFNIMYNQIGELQEKKELVVDAKDNCLISNSRNLNTESEKGCQEELDSIQEDLDVRIEVGINHCIQLKSNSEVNRLPSSGTEFEISRPRHDKDPNIFIPLRNSDFSSVHVDETAGHIEINVSQYGIVLRNRFKQMEEKSKKISKVSSQNIEILAAMNSLNVCHLITKMKTLQISTEVKEREKFEQQKKFEKYIRILLGQVREYKKSYVAVKEQNVYLKDLFGTFIPEQSSNEPIILRWGSSQHFGIGNVKWNTDNIHSDSGFTSFSEISQSNETLVTACNFTGHLMNDSLCTEIQILDTTDEHQNLVINDSTQKAVVIVEVSCNHKTSKCDFNNIVMLGSYLIDQLKNLLERKEQRIISLCNQLLISNELLNDSRNEVNFLQKDITMLNSQLQRNIMIIDELKQEKLSLENCLKQREELLGKIFVAFKQKIQQALDEANDKFFLQRLCSDLKFAIKMYAGQNKILRDVLQNRNKGITLNIDEKSGKYREKFLSLLRNQQDDYYCVKESFLDIQSYIDSMKKQMSLLQAVATQS